VCIRAPGPAGSGPTAPTATNAVTQTEVVLPPTVPSTLSVPIASGLAPALVTDEQHAKDEIARLIKNYCAEYETLDASRVKKLFPHIDERSLRDGFGQYRSLRCTVTSALEFDRLDSGPLEARRSSSG
jgi:hypothetical protein